MTTPDTKMLSAERLAELPVTARMLRKQAADLWPDVNESGQVHFGRAVMESAAEAIEAACPDIDVLAARVAELEQNLLDAVPDDVLAEHATGLEAEVQRLESELAAARAPVGDSEIAEEHDNLRVIATLIEAGAYPSVDLARSRAQAMRRVADLITRLARERDEAMRPKRRSFWVIEWKDGPGDVVSPVPRYWSARHGWVFDIDQAQQFCRKADAESAEYGRYGLHGNTVKEHVVLGEIEAAESRIQQLETALRSSRNLCTNWADRPDFNPTLTEVHAILSAALGAKP